MKRIALCIAMTVLAGGLAGAPASAAPGSCRASAVRVTPAGFAAEPLVANPAGMPCATDVKRLGQVPALSSGLAPDGMSVLAGPQSYGIGNYAQAIVAYSTLPSILVAGVAGLRSNAVAECLDGKPALTGTSSVAILYGVEAPPPAQLPLDGAPMTIPVGAGTLYLNEQIRTATQITQRAVRLHTQLADIVVSEASASIEGACPAARRSSRARRAKARATRRTRGRATTQARR